MKTNPESPNLEELKALLADSFHAEEDPRTPPMPEDLRERLRDQYGRIATPPGARPTPESLFDRVRRLFMTPAMAGAAAAAVLVVVAAILILPPERDTRMRGTSASAPTVSIVLHQIDGPTREALIAAGFDRRALRSVTDLPPDVAARSPAIVIDGPARQIAAYPRNASRPATTTPIPDNPAAIAAKVAELLNEFPE